MKSIQVVGGPNGSGKTTFAEVLFKKKNGYSTFINRERTFISGSYSGCHIDDLTGFICMLF